MSTQNSHEFLVGDKVEVWGYVKDAGFRGAASPNFYYVTNTIHTIRDFGLNGRVVVSPVDEGSEDEYLCHFKQLRFISRG